MSQELKDKLDLAKKECELNNFKINEYQERIFPDIFNGDFDNLKVYYSFLSDGSSKVSFSLINNPSKTNHSINFTFSVYLDKLITSHYISFLSKNSKKNINDLNNYISSLNSVNDFINNIDESNLIDLLIDYKKNINKKIKLINNIKEIETSLINYKNRSSTSDVLNFLTKKVTSIEDFILENLNIKYDKTIKDKEKKEIIIDYINQEENEKNSNKKKNNHIDLFCLINSRYNLNEFEFKKMILSFSLDNKNKLKYSINLKSITKTKILLVLSSQIKIKNKKIYSVLDLNRELKLKNKIKDTENINELAKKLCFHTTTNKIKGF